MVRKFQGTGWSFPVRTDADGAVDTASGSTDIEQSIRIVLGTAPGERVMRPDFGCGIHSFAFATIDGTTLALVETRVEEALERWEPRIEVLAVDAVADMDETGRIDVEIRYREKRSNDEQNLVYPFYVEGV